MTDPRIEAAAKAIAEYVYERAGKPLKWEDMGGTRQDVARDYASVGLAAADAADPLAKIEEVLWCVTVAGPDELHAVPDYATGVRKARELNEWLERNNKKDENAPIIFALIDEWPWDAESHAKDLVRQEKEEAAIAARREKKLSDALGGRDG